MEKRDTRRDVRLFVLVLVCTALATGLGSNIFSNYFKEAFLVDSVQRGFLEIPRESPGILCMVLVAWLGCLGNLRVSILAQLLSLAGLTVMGLFSPSYGVMMIFLFLQSLGMHLFMPLSDAISMDLAREGEVGATLGRFKGVSTFATMAAACLVFFGFRWGFFSFTSPLIVPFALAAAATAAAVVFLLLMVGRDARQGERQGTSRFVFRREYAPYYLVTLAYGCQKRIKIVFAPWVIIELLGQGADTVALLTIATYLAGTLAAPWIGRMLDRVGVRTMLRLEAGYIALSFCALGALAGLLTGSEGSFGLKSWLVYGAYILCVLFEQFNMVHSYMMRALARDPGEVTRTLSVGLSFDHVMAIAASPVLGIVWSTWGVEWVFYLSALSAVLQLLASVMVGKNVRVEVGR